MGMLDPLDWASAAISAENSAEAWGKLFGELGAHGFENCSATVMEIGKYVLTDQSHGVVITEDFEEHVRDHPEMTQSMDLLVQYGKYDRVTACTQGHPEFALWTERDLSFYKRMQDFGFRGGFGASLVDPWRREFTVMTASCFTTEAEAIEAYDRIAADLLPAVVFLQEGLRVKDLVGNRDWQPLSHREQECLVWVCSGMMNGQIAERTGLSEFTVQEYIRNACKKLNARTRAQAAARATLLHLISP